MAKKKPKQPIKRVSNWPAVLAAWIEEKRGVPFDWVANNCCFFAGDWIKAVTGGLDVAASYRKRCTTARRAAGLLKREGGAEAIAGKVCKRQGWPEVLVKRAQRGDVVSVDTPSGPALAVCVGGQVALAAHEGIRFVALSTGRKAWRIG